MSVLSIFIFWTYAHFINAVWYVAAFFTIWDLIQTIQYYRRLRKQSPNNK